MRNLIFLKLQEGVELFYTSNGKKFLKGCKRGEGILCFCCMEVVSPSKFEAHAGFSSRRQPYRGISTANGVSLDQLGKSISSNYPMNSMDKQSGHKKQFVSCIKCNQPFEAGLPISPSIPTDSELLCLSCKQNIWRQRAYTPRRHTYKEIEFDLQRIMEENSEDIYCILCRESEFDRENEFSSRSSILCGQCKRLFHVDCLREQYAICDLEERTVPKISWFCSIYCKEVHEYLRWSVYNSPNAIHFSSKNQTVKLLFEGRVLPSHNEHEVKWHLLSGINRTCDNEVLFSEATMIFTEAFGPILEDGYDLIPAMVKGSETPKQDFGRMHCVVITRMSDVVSVGLLRVFGQELAELPLVATDRDWRRTGYFKTLLYVVEQLLITLKVKTLVLPVDEEAQLFWIKQFGFVKISNDLVKQYAEDYQIVRFKKKIVLAKSFPQFQRLLNID